MERKVAEAVYRSAWQQWCLTGHEDKKRFLEQTMDYVQPFIAKSPKDPHWDEFVSTLPGYKEFWADWGAGMEAFIHQKKL